MRAETAKQFKDIYDEMMEKAERVQCDLEEFRDAMVAYADDLSERIDGLNDELASLDHDEDEEEVP